MSSKHLATLLLAGSLAVFASLSARAQYGDGPSQRVEGRLTNAPKPATPTPAAANAKPGVKMPLEATLSRDEKGRGATTVFASSDPKIYLTWKDDSATKGDKLRIVWVAEDTGGALPKNKTLTDFAQTLPGPGSFGTSFQPAPIGTFPPGKYRVDLSENAKVVKSLKFTVKK